jgi:hypothetical protein
LEDECGELAGNDELGRAQEGIEVTFSEPAVGGGAVRLAKDTRLWREALVDDVDPDRDDAPDKF